MDWKWFFLSFDGRISRKPFWMALLIFLMLNFIANRADAAYFFAAPRAGPVSALVGLVLIWPSLAVAAKRWHDRNKSAWWILINLVPLIGWIWSFIETALLPGTPGENRFGPDPLADYHENEQD